MPPLARLRDDWADKWGEGESINEKLPEETTAFT